jgi:hypothetical protein
MTDISYPILRTGKTDIAGSVDVTPSGGSTGTAIVAADLVDGFAKKTVSFAANETSKTVTFAVADDSAVEGPETYRLTMSNPQPSGAFPNGAFVEGTVADNDSGGGTPAPTLTYAYGPADGAADSGDVNIQSTLQQLGRTWRSGAPKWKVVLAQSSTDATATGLFMRFDDDLGKLTYANMVNRGNQTGVEVSYTGTAPSAAEPYTYVISDAAGIRYYCATSSAGANARLLVTIPYSIWDDATFWGSQQAADRVPGKYAQANAHNAVANGIYAARLGDVQA